ncbi:MAG: hypothetical protein EOP38_16880 [Rubrivivax sp.]|nr:MAG: hypothetical protein EOP38_16880 [Rubrivivax sp.]
MHLASQMDWDEVEFLSGVEAAIIERLGSFAQPSFGNGHARGPMRAPEQTIQTGGGQEKAAMVLRALTDRRA